MRQPFEGEKTPTLNTINSKANSSCQVTHRFAALIDPLTQMAANKLRSLSHYATHRHHRAFGEVKISEDHCPYLCFLAWTVWDSWLYKDKEESCGRDRSASLRPKSSEMILPAFVDPGCQITFLISSDLLTPFLSSTLSCDGLSAKPRDSIH